MTDHTRTWQERHPRAGLMRYAPKIYGFEVTLRVANGQEVVMTIVPEHSTSARAASRVRQEIIDEFGADHVLKIKEFQAYQWRLGRTGAELI